MRVMITGIDGYLGWPLALHLAKQGHEIGGIDNHFRRGWVQSVGSDSAIPIASMKERREAFKEHTKKTLHFWLGDLTNWQFTRDVYKRFQPDAIVYLGEMPSAPYSMVDAQHAIDTQTNNVMGTLATLYAMKEVCPKAHLVKLGTMGEYGTPNVDIPEGFFDVKFRGREDRMMFPRKAGSWYHQSKVHDTHNIEMACRIWGLCSTDVMQGVVYGIHTSETQDDFRLATRFDFDECFGTVLNRFCTQAVIGEPITPYGKGSQQRGFLSLSDSIQCVQIALENSPEPGEYRVFNQFAETYAVQELAEKVQQVGNQLGLSVSVQHVENPRVESEDHYYNPDHQTLLELGYHPTLDVHGELLKILNSLIPYKKRIAQYRGALRPTISFK